MDDLARPTLPTVTRLVALGVQRSPSPAPIGIMPNVPQFTTLAAASLAWSASSADASSSFILVRSG